jgi:hypothetical protein
VSNEFINYKTLIPVSLDTDLLVISYSDSPKLYELKKGCFGFVSFEDLQVWGETGFKEDVEVMFHFNGNDGNNHYTIVPAKCLLIGY